jgi:hypothetical protein
MEHHWAYGTLWSREGGQKKNEASMIEVRYRW